MAQIGSLVADLVLETSRFNGNIEKAQRSLDTSTARMNRTLGKLDRGLAAVTRTAGAFGVAFGTGALVSFTKASLDAAEAIGDTAIKANSGVEGLQRLQFAASNFGSSARDIDDGLTRLNRRLGLFIADGGGPAAAAIERLGLEFRNASGEVKTTDRLFLDIAERLRGVGSEAERAALASQLFGEDTGPRLARLLAEGREGIIQAGEAASVFSNKTVAEASAVNAQFRELINTIGIDLKSAFVETVAEFERLSRQGRKELKSLIDLLKGEGSFADFSRTVRGIGPGERLTEVKDALQRARDELKAAEGFAAAKDQTDSRRVQEARAEVQRLTRERNILEEQLRERGGGPAGSRGAAGGVVIPIPSAGGGDGAGSGSGGGSGRSGGGTTVTTEGRITDELGRQAEALQRQFQTREERAQADLETARELFEMEKVGADTVQRAQEAVWEIQRERLDEAAAKEAEMRQEMIRGGEDFANSLDRAFADGKLSASEIVDLMRSGAELFGIDLQNALGGIGGLGGGGGGGILDGIGGLFSGFGGFFADGGTLGAGQWGVAGEAGPELVSGPARITPMSDIGEGGGGIQIVNNITVSNTVAPQEFAARLSRDISDRTQAEIMRSMDGAGRFAKASGRIR